MKFESSKRAAAERWLLNARPMEAELADGAAVRNAPKQMVKKIAKAPPLGSVDVDGAAARADVLLAHAQVDVIEAAQDLKQNSQAQKAERELVSNPHPGVFCQPRVLAP
jgi:hypothetical protein